MNQLDLKGRHAIITGGASGLGYAISQRMLASGASVTWWDVNADVMAQAAKTIGADVHCEKVDVTQHTSVVAALARTVPKRGRVDILVNSAGITGPNVKLADYPPTAWNDVMQVNVNGTFHCCRELATHMQGNKYGRIVNIASVAGKEGNPNASAYSASKAAVIALTKSLGKELANSGVLVNCVTPAAVKTAMFDQMTPEHIAFMLSKIPMGRFGNTDEVAAMVSWLCTEDCSFTTGAVFDLSGGRSTY
ncbi:MAG: SDR family NAD(P)-dependent oxidoreductase [Burkholderiaceae bacterium]